MKWHHRSREEVLRDLDGFLAEFQAESDRGAALLGATLLDERLGEIILAFLAETESSKRLMSGFNAPLHSFWARTETAHALGLVTDDEYDNLTLIRRVRNEFAHHTHGLAFESETVFALCHSLSAGFVIKRRGASREAGEREAREVFGDTPRIRFQQAVITLLFHLMYRAHFVEKQKRKLADWPSGMKARGENQVLSTEDSETQ